MKLVPFRRLVTFTGSGETGKQDYARAAADTVKVVSLEMGVLASLIVMDDADLESAVKTAVFSRFPNAAEARNLHITSGPMCMYGIAEKVHFAFSSKRFSEPKVGDPLAAGVQLGPKVNRQELEKVERYVDEARSARAGGGLFESGRAATSLKPGTGMNRPSSPTFART